MSVAWRLSEEAFLQGARSRFLDNLKLRFREVIPVIQM